MFRHIMTHLDAHNVLADLQHGFRSNRSCEKPLINTIEHLARSINNRNQTDLLILDFSKAFDTVAHKCLFLEIKYYGTHNHHLNWIQSVKQNSVKVVLEGQHQESHKEQSTGPFAFHIFRTGRMCYPSINPSNWPTLKHRRKVRLETLIQWSLFRYRHHVMKISAVSGLEQSMTGTVYHQIS